MEAIELQLDHNTLNRVRQLAASRQCTIEELLKALIRQLSTDAATHDPVLGMFADEPLLIDQVVASAIKDRETQVLREDGGQSVTGY